MCAIILCNAARLLSAKGNPPHQESGWQARRDSNPQPPDLESGALPFELLAYLFCLFMKSMRLAKRAVFLHFQFMRHGLFVFRRCIVPLLARLAGQRNGISHILTYLPE